MEDATIIPTNVERLGKHTKSLIIETCVSMWFGIVLLLHVINHLHLCTMMDAGF